MSKTPSDILRDLTDVSPQITHAVLATLDGSVIESLYEGDDERAQELADRARQLLDAADTARKELQREPVVQCDVMLENGHIFIVTDKDHLLLAITKSNPTIGLVFYDLKTALRQLAASTSNS